MVNAPCVVNGCPFRTGDYPAAVVAQMLANHHMDSHAAPAAAPVAQTKAPKVDRPTLSDDMDEEGWNVFLLGWSIYAKANRLVDEDLAVQLYQCCSNTLKKKISSVYSDFHSRPVDDLLPLLKTLTVIPVAISVKRNELLQMKQDAGDTIRSFHSRVKSKATTCYFKVACRHPHAPDADGQPVGIMDVDYTCEMIRHVVLNGIYDDEIKREIFGNDRIDVMDVSELVKLIESKETARDATDFSSNSISSFKRRNKQTSNNTKVPPPSPIPSPIDYSRKEKCGGCSLMFDVYRKMRNGQFNKKPFSHCKSCWVKLRSEKEASEITAEHNAITFEISSNSLGSSGSASTDQSVHQPPVQEPVVQQCSTEYSEKQPLVGQPVPQSSTDQSLHQRPVEQPVKLLSTEHPVKQPLVEQPVQISTMEQSVKQSVQQLSIEECKQQLPTKVSNASSLEKPMVVPDNEYDVHHVDTGNDCGIVTQYNAGRLILRHHIFVDGQWKMRLALPHPTLSIMLTTNTDDYKLFKLKPPRIRSLKITAVADSGAQVCVWSWVLCKAAGFSRADLIPVKQKLNAVSKSSITIYGALLLRLSGISATGEEHSAAAIVYVSPDVSSFYMSQDVMVQLCIVSPEFPAIGCARQGKTLPSENASFEQDITQESCPCLPRSAPPGCPDKLPMAATAENVSRMKSWLLERYASSVFNKCPHQPSPKMKGPPMRIHVDPNAKGKVFTTPLKVPIHWEPMVENDLKRDVNLGVIEPVPHGETSKWVHRMLVIRKPNGELRRVVDLSPLNKHCEREVHAMQSPFELAKGIPPDTWRTVTDASNAYHAIPLHEDDRHLTTFLSSTGHRYRYLVAPQGFSSSGDGYNRRCDEIFSPFERRKRCMDDTLLHDPHESLEDHWWRVINFLECCGENGFILNPKKFQFCQKEVDFAGFHLSESTVEPLEKYLTSIKNFPTPTCITDIQSWFGLVNQVAHYAQLRDLMEPFRKFLSPKVVFTWDSQLDVAFNKSKDQIISAIKQGVEIFDVKRKTCLRTDWSKQGIGFYLSQKHCGCDSDVPNCCEDGWRITLCGSRFLNQAEGRYAPIEGEALAVAWALQQTKYFTMGCDDLVVVVDHKPLTKLLGDRRLDEIPNPRLFRLKQRTLPWRFDIHWLPGKTNTFSDATSRHPTGTPTEEDNTETLVCLINAHLQEEGLSVVEGIMSIGAVRANLNNVTAITWEKLQQTTFEEMQVLLALIKNGFPVEKGPHPSSELSDFWSARNDLHIHDDVIMYKDRVVVPPSLRLNALESIHAAHQGTSSMMSTAESTVFWPNITKDISATRHLCKWCNTNAPSQPKLPPITPVIPTTPFQAIVADYFEAHGSNYLVIADRLSAWTEAYHTKVVDNGNKSKGLITLLKRFFGTFGVPEEIAFDGGPQFAANNTVDFLTRWGVNIRPSAAYHPQSNGRAELAVKSVKRLIEGNVDENGSLDTEAFLRAILIKRNTPDPLTKLSPADIVFGRKLNDTLPRVNKTVNIFFNEQFQPAWRKAWKEKEEALRARYQGCQARLAEHSKSLPKLAEGDRVMIQNQHGLKPTKWDRSGTVVEVRDFDKYIVKVDGSGRLTMRNRRFLKKLFSHLGLARCNPPLASPQPPRLNQNICGDANNNDNHLTDNNNNNNNNVRRRTGTRFRSQRKVYDAASGTFVVPIGG